MATRPNTAGTIPTMKLPPGKPGYVAPDYQPTCPICGADLQPVLLGPDSPPWVCVGDSRAWWPSELVEEYRKDFNPVLREFRGKARRELPQRIIEDRDNARFLGTSRIPEHDRGGN